jgi:hypothetical protein
MAMCFRQHFLALPAQRRGGGEAQRTTLLVVRNGSPPSRSKGLAFDSGPPLVWDEPAVTYERASDEHGRLALSGATNRLGPGDKIRPIPGHCDPTVNLYDWYVGVRGNASGRSGRSQRAVRCVDVRRRRPAAGRTDLPWQRVRRHEAAGPRCASQP